MPRDLSSGRIVGSFQSFGVRFNERDVRRTNDRLCRVGQGIAEFCLAATQNGLPARIDDVGIFNGLLASGAVTVNEGGQAIVSHVSHGGHDSKETLIIRAFEALPKGDIVQQSV